MAIKVGGTEVISDSRALSNIASVDAATVTALSDAGVGGGGGLFTATAYESLTAGDPVYMRDDGKVAITSGHTFTDSGVGDSGFIGGKVKAFYDTVGDRFVVVFADSNNSSNFYAIAYTVVDGVVTAGSKTLVFTTSETQYVDVETVHQTPYGLVFIAKMREQLKAFLIQGTGTTVTVPSTVNLFTLANQTDIPRSAINSTKDVICVIGRSVSLNRVVAMNIQVYNGLLAVGTQFDVGSGTIIYPSGILYDSTTDCFTCMGYTLSTIVIQNLHARVLNYTGTTLSFQSGSELVHDFQTATVGNDSAYSAVMSNFIEIDGVHWTYMSYGPRGDNYVDRHLVGFTNGRIDTNASHTFWPAFSYRIYLGQTYRAGTSMLSNTFPGEITYIPSVKRLVVPQTSYSFHEGVTQYTVFDMSLAHNPVVTKIVSPLGTTATENLNIFNFGYVGVNSLGNGKDNLVVDADAGKLYVFDIPTDSNCIGICQSTVAADQTTDVVISGGISSVHTGLTVGSPYFATGSSVSTDNEAGRSLGYAISSTEIVMTGA